MDLILRGEAIYLINYSIEVGPYVPTMVAGNTTIEKPREEWSEEERRLVQYNLKAKNIITSALGMDEYFRVSNCKSAKDMWDTLQVTHEGTTDVKRSRINTLTHEYELFRMKTNESTIQDMQKRFTHDEPLCLPWQWLESFRHWLIRFT